MVPNNVLKNLEIHTYRISIHRETVLPQLIVTHAQLRLNVCHIT